MDLQQYRSYTTEDFILDEEFRDIVFKSGSNGRLKKIVSNLPEKKAEIILAAKLVRNIQAAEFRQSEIRKRELWQQIVVQQNKQKRFIFLRFAASFLLLVGIGSLAYFLIHQKQTAQVAVSTKLSESDALLILANGKTVSINSKLSTIQYSADGADIIIDSAGVVQTVSDNGFNQMIVPFGKRSFIILSEGTKVWLNSGSKLIFPPTFKGKTREVMLEGEAFFDVSHNAEKPFYVKTDALRMKVYGTKFNVQAYHQDMNYNIVLVEGKVSLNSTSDLQAKEVFLAPSQKASIIKGAEKIEVTTVESTDIYTAWVDGYLTFSDEDLSDLLKRVSRYYNAEIEIEPNLNLQTIYGKLDLKDDLERVLDGIAFISKTHYIKQGNKYIFKAN